MTEKNVNKKIKLDNIHVRHDFHEIHDSQNVEYRK